MSGKGWVEPGSSLDEQTLLSYFLKTVPYGPLPADAQPQSLHPYLSSPGDSVTRLREIIKTSEVLNIALYGYAITNVTERKLVSVLQQTTALVKSLHTVSCICLSSSFSA